MPKPKGFNLCPSQMIYNSAKELAIIVVVSVRVATTAFCAKLKDAESLFSGRNRVSKTLYDIQNNWLPYNCKFPIFNYGSEKIVKNFFAKISAR